MEIKELVNEIGVRTSLYYEDEDDDGNLVLGGLYTLKEIIEDLKRLEKEQDRQVKALKKKLKQEVIRGNVIVLPVNLRDKHIVGDLYLLGKNQIVTSCLFQGKVVK